MKVPNGEQVWVSYYDIDKNLTFLLTSKKQRDYYYLYKVNGDQLVKLGKSKSPTELVSKYKVDDVIYAT